MHLRLYPRHPHRGALRRFPRCHVVRRHEPDRLDLPLTVGDPGQGGLPVVDLPFRAPAATGRPGSTFTACEHWHAFAQEQIRQLHPDLVFLTQYPNFGPGDVPYRPTRWCNALIDEVRRLPVPPSRVIVLGNIPQTASNGPDCLSHNPDDVQRCSGPIAPYISGMSAAERQAASTTGAKYIDVVPLVLLDHPYGRHRPLSALPGPVPRHRRVLDRNRRVPRHLDRSRRIRNADRRRPTSVGPGGFDHDHRGVRLTALYDPVDPRDGGAGSIPGTPRSWTCSVQAEPDQYRWS